MKSQGELRDVQLDGKDPRFLVALVQFAALFYQKPGIWAESRIALIGNQ